jgi:hypothetical protein
VSDILAISDPSRLIALYRQREPTTLEELLAAGIARTEERLLLGDVFFATWLYFLAPKGIRSFYVRADDGSPLMVEGSHWTQMFPHVAAELSAHAFALGRRFTSRADDDLFQAAVIDALGADGRHMRAVCQLEGLGPETGRRVGDWTYADATNEASPEEIEMYAPLRAVLADGTTDAGAQPPPPRARRRLRGRRCRGH